MKQNGYSVLHYAYIFNKHYTQDQELAIYDSWAIGPGHRAGALAVFGSKDFTCVVLCCTVARQLDGQVMGNSSLALLQPGRGQMQQQWLVPSTSFELGHSNPLLEKAANHCPRL